MQSASKTRGILGGGASSANSGYVLANCGGGGHRINRPFLDPEIFPILKLLDQEIYQSSLYILIVEKYALFSEYLVMLT